MIENFSSLLTSDFDFMNKLEMVKTPGKSHSFKKLNFENYHIFNDEYGMPFISLINSSVSHPLNSSEAKKILQKEYYNQTEKVLNKNKEDELIRFIEMTKNSENKSFEVAIRTTSKDDIFYYDLGTSDSKLMRISKDGINEIIEPSIKFKRPKTSREVFYTNDSSNESLRLLKTVLNIQSSHDLILILAYIIKSILGKSGSSPILNIEGEQGSSKTTTTKMLKRIIDPSTSDIKKFPTKMEDLHNYAVNNYLLCFDNLSGLNHQVSDELCIISTGGAITKRMLYTNADECTYNIQRPVILNGIEEIGERPDFLDRSITIYLPPIEPDKRKSEIELWKNFEEILPQIVGSMFNLAAQVLKVNDGYNYQNLPRMAEFAIIGNGIEKILDFRTGFFMEAFKLSKERQINQIISTNPLLITIKSFMSGREIYEGSPHNLFTLLKELAVAQKINYGFPQTPSTLTKTLTRHQSSLKHMGIIHQRGKDSKGRVLILKKSENLPSQLSMLSITNEKLAVHDVKDTKDGSNANK